MENFNKMLDSIKNGAKTPDTDSDTGSFGNTGAEDVAPAGGEKLVLHLEGGIEIHIPTAVYDSMSSAMGGGMEMPQAPVESPCGGGGPLMGAEDASEESGEESKEESGEKKECPFEKKDDSDDKSDSDKDDEKKDEE